MKSRGTELETVISVLSLIICVRLRQTSERHLDTSGVAEPNIFFHSLL